MGKFIPVLKECYLKHEEYVGVGGSKEWLLLCQRQLKMRLYLC